jgi:hypothetical protein
MGDRGGMPIMGGMGGGKSSGAGQGGYGGAPGFGGIGGQQPGSGNPIGTPRPSAFSEFFKDYDHAAAAKAANPYGFTAPTGPSTNAFVPFYNSKTGETYMAPGGGYTPPSADWMQGTPGQPQQPQQPSQIGSQLDFFNNMMRGQPANNLGQFGDPRSGLNQAPRQIAQERQPFVNPKGNMSPEMQDYYARDRAAQAERAQRMQGMLGGPALGNIPGNPGFPDPYAGTGGPGAPPPPGLGGQPANNLGRNMLSGDPMQFGQPPRGGIGRFGGMDGLRQFSQPQQQPTPESLYAANMGMPPPQQFNQQRFNPFQQQFGGFPNPRQQPGRFQQQQQPQDMRGLAQLLSLLRGGQG